MWSTWGLSWQFWLIFGAAGQALFTARFLVQWLASERKGDSVMPVAFWWLSLMGGTVLLTYAIARREPVFAVGQAMGLVVYVRNLALLGKAKRRQEKDARRRHLPRPHLDAAAVSDVAEAGGVQVL